MSKPRKPRKPRQPEDACPIEPPVGPHPRPAGALARFAVAVAAFAVVLLTLHAVATPGGGSMIGSKVQHYRLAAERYDTIFLGTSHVYRSFVPEEFDRVLAEGGVEASSFNYGVQLPNQVELHYLLRTALADGKGWLKRVFVEYCELMPQVDPEQAFIARNVYWHDRVGTSLAIDRAWELDETMPGGIRLAPDPKRRHAILAIVERWFPARFYLARQHSQHFVKRELMVARTKDVARGILRRPHGMVGKWRETRGYVSLEEDAALKAGSASAVNALVLRRQALLDGRDEFLAHVERLRTEDVVWGDQEWMNSEVERINDLEVYRSMARVAREAGVELIVVVMPSNSCDRPFEATMEERIGARVLRYNLPDEYPRFYDPALRFDSGHLSEEGALEFTSVLAEDYLLSRDE